MDKRQVWLWVLIVAGATGAGCDGKDGAGVVSATAQASSGALFDKELRKKGCELLTAQLLAETFKVPEGELKQMKMMGCTYTWRNDSEELEASIMMIRAHKNAAAAEQWFQNATASKTR